MIGVGNLHKFRQTSDKARRRGKIKLFIKPATIYRTIPNFLMDRDYDA